MGGGLEGMKSEEEEYVKLERNVFRRDGVKRGGVRNGGSNRGGL